MAQGVVRDKETGGQAEVARSLARALQERFIEPSAARIEEQEARVKLLQEKVAALEKEIGRLRLLQKKTAAGVCTALAGVTLTALALIVLNVR